MLVASEIPLSRIWHLRFPERKSKGISILTGTHINHDRIHDIKKIGSPRESHLKGLLSLLHLDLEGATEVDINPKGRFVSFKVSPSNDKVLCIYGSSWYSSREQLARGRFFEWLKNYMGNKYG